jgi:hypothetical protein
MPFTEDFTVFTDPAVDGTVGSYTPQGGVTSDVNGIFDADYDDDLNMEGSAPMFSCAAADVVGVRHGDAFVIDSVDYIVCNVRPDGTGWVRLKLELA